MEYTNVFNDRDHAWDEAKGLHEMRVKELMKSYCNMLRTSPREMYMKELLKLIGEERALTLLDRAETLILTEKRKKEEEEAQSPVERLIHEEEGPDVKIDITIEEAG